MANLIPVEVVYGLPHRQVLLQVDVPIGTSAAEAVGLSRIALEFPDVDFTEAPKGMFGQAFGTKGLPSAQDYQVQANDRIEIYRPLTSDPKEVRRKRAAKAAGE